MPDSLDTALAGLTATPVPAGLDRLEEDVFARIAATGERRGAPAAGMLGIAVALVIGVGGGMLGGGAAPASAAPIGIDGTLAPSTLLLGR